ncbi:MAG: phage major capsid protein, partial [Candidatus Caldarchaeum sp.]
TLVTGDLAAGGLLAPEQAEQFLRLAVKASPNSQEAVVRIMNTPKWEEPILSWGGRILRPGTEGVRLADADRVKPTTGKVELSTVLLRGEVPVSDEVMESNIERADFADTLAAYIAERVGSDLEELYVKGDTTSGDPFLATLNGLLKQARGTGGHIYDAVNDGQDYQKVFDALITSVPDQYRRDMTTWRFYVSPTVKERYHSQVASRGTPLGDAFLTAQQAPTYKGVRVVAVPHMPDANILLIQPSNIYIGFHRRVQLERFRDPREGVTSFVVSTRTDVKIAVVDASAIAINVQ